MVVPEECSRTGTSPASLTVSGAVNPLMLLKLLVYQPGFCLHLDTCYVLPLCVSISPNNKATSPFGLELILQHEPILTNYTYDDCFSK